MTSRPKFWPQPRPQRFGLSLGLGLEALASASSIWPRSGLDLVVLLCSLIGHFRAKSCKNSGILLIFPAIILNRMWLIIIWYFFHNYFWPRPWPQPLEIGFGLGLSLVALASASASASRFWPRLTSLMTTVWMKFTWCIVRLFCSKWQPKVSIWACLTFFAFQRLQRDDVIKSNIPCMRVWT